MSMDTVSCPVCFVEYEAEPVRCEACGYRFGKAPTVV